MSVVVSDAARQRLQRGWWDSPSRAAILIFALALAARLVVLALLWSGAPAPMDTLLGPDSRGYLTVAQALAARHFHLPGHPTSVLGTYDVGAYYLFGAVAWLGGGLLQLQLLNVLLGALAAAFVYAAARRTVPSLAPVAGLLVALNPSLIALSSFGLLKDPSIMCASAVFVYALIAGFAAADDPSRRGRLWPWLLVIAALAYLRMARFYTAAYFELGLVAAMIAATYHRDRQTRLAIGLPALAAVVAAELIVIAFGWPSSPRLVIDQIFHVMGHPLMRYSSQGMADVWVAAAAASGSHEGKAGAIQLIDVVRRTFGPFVWVAPPSWDRLTLIYTNDFVLYPGTLVWYALQPYLLAGIWVSARAVRSCRIDRMWLLVLAVFSVVYLLQFAAVNLSYRQRDAMFPVFVLIALIGYTEVRGWRPWRAWYAAYWGALATLAGAHLALTAVLRG